MIELIHLSKRYGDTRAVDDISLTVEKGQLFGFIGPNGAGKTTTIRMIGGLLAPSEGRVVVDGIDMAEDPVSVKARIGLIPDRPFLYEKLTGMEFLQFTADLYGVNGNRFRGRADELLTLFSLKHRSDELVEAYSHGMKQRLIMAAALLHEPPLLIVDEPMVGLDPRGIKMVRELFRSLVAKGMTIFMSTHTLSLAEDVCDHIGIIHNGRLIANGPIDAVKRNISGERTSLERAFLEVTGEPSP
ncbi:MAG: ABC transporter ATP-binding protein [Pseudomonadota bacterium]